MPYAIGNRLDGGVDQCGTTPGVCISSFDCGIGNHVLLNVSIGGVCFGSETSQGWGNGNEGFTDLFGNPAGSTASSHLGVSPTMSFSVVDDFFSLTAAVYCQNFQFDNRCGSGTNAPAETEEGGNPAPQCQVDHVEGVNGCNLRSEPFVYFCDSLTIRSGLDGPVWPRRTAGYESGSAGSGDWADPTLPNWDTDLEVFIFIFGPISGNPGDGGNPCGPNHAWGTEGIVAHG